MTMTDSSSWGLGAMVETYRIQMRGHLDDRWSDWLDGLVIQRQEDGTTVLVGPVLDQAALHGVIARIRDLGLPLLSLNREVDDDASTSREFGSGDAKRTLEGIR